MNHASKSEPNFNDDDILRARLIERGWTPPGVHPNLGIKPLENEICVNLWYPRCAENAKWIVIDLVDVRASDGIRVSYDFERDGWKIEQASRFSFEPNEPIDLGWIEVSFIQAWGSRIDEDDSLPLENQGVTET